MSSETAAALPELDRPSDVPTAILPPEPGSGTRPLTYLGKVRKTLMDLGSPNPDGDIAATGEFWSHAQKTGVDATTAAAVIYATARHRHPAGSQLREGAEETVDRTSIYRSIRHLPPGAELAVPYSEAKAMVSYLPFSGTPYAVSFRSSGSIEIGFASRDDAEKFFEQAISSGHIEQAELRIDAPGHPRGRLVDQFPDDSAAESPTREEWEVLVRRHGSMDKIIAAAGRKPDEATHTHVTFGDFYDDERAAAFARKMTRAGYIATYGPRRMAAEAAEAPGASERAALRWTEVWWQFPADGEKFAELLEKMHNTIVAVAQNRIVRTNATGKDIERIIAKHRWKGRYILDQSTVRKTDLAAETAASPTGEAACDSCIPWQKVSRTGGDATQAKALAAKYGKLKTAQDIYRVCGADLIKETQEVFLVLPLNIHGELMSPPYEVARGQRDRVTVGIDNVMDAASDARCAGFVVVHQHPGGKAHPSKKDISLTESIRRATPPGRKFVDHVVIAQGSAYSVVERKLYKCAGG